jgi:hypothetical protein
MSDDGEKDPSTPTAGGAWLKGPFQLPFIVLGVIVVFLIVYVFIH